MPTNRRPQPAACARKQDHCYVTDLPESEANAWQVQALYRERADAENIFDEPKNQWASAAFARTSARSAASPRTRSCSFTTSGTCSPGAWNRAGTWKPPGRAAGSS